MWKLNSNKIEDEGEMTVMTVTMMMTTATADARISKEQTNDTKGKRCGSSVKKMLG